MTDDFYIGYEPRMPASLVPRVRLAVATLVALALVTGLGLALAQDRFAPGIFEFGRERVFDGRLVERPYPMVAVAGARYWLVGPGKHGAASIVAGLDGRTVRVTGTLIERDGDRMIQIEPGSVVPVNDVVESSPVLRETEVATFDGEIVDSKCHLGVMKPGEGPVHRDCAMRCLLGGVPPMLVVRTGSGTRRLPLVSTDARPLALDLEPWVARPVRVHGVVYTRGGEQYLSVARERINVLP